MRTILILFTIYLVFKVFFKYIFPTLMSIAANKIAQQAQQRNQHSAKPEGHAEIKTSGSMGSANTYGEYVEYEEVK